MIEATFPEGEKVRAIILDEAIDSVSGIVECCKCDWRAGILTSDTEEQTKDIVEFAKAHTCGIRGYIKIF